MSLLVVSAVGGVVQVLKALYEYYNIHQRNKSLLDILEGFSQNLETAIERLQVRESLLVGTKNPALESIGKDFENARAWLLANDKNLRSAWTALQAKDKLADLDARLTKAFSSKMAIALFTAVQDQRHATQNIQKSIDGLSGNLEMAVKQASKEGLQDAIRELKEEAYASRNVGHGRGFTNGEAERIISHLVDQLTAQERLRATSDIHVEEASDVFEPQQESMDVYSQSYRNYSSSPAGSSSDKPTVVPYTPASSSSPKSNVVPYSSLAPSGSSSTTRTNSYDDSLFSREEKPESVSTVDANERAHRKRGKQKSMIPGSILFSPVDPYTGGDLIDPVLANDGLIHDRWTLVEKRYENARDPFEPLMIVGDVVQLREAIFASYPQRRQSFETKRQVYKEQAILSYENGDHNSLPETINQLSHVLLWEPTSISLHVRRGIAKYRIRDVSALQDFNIAISLSTRSDSPEDDGPHEPDLDALRARALLKEELHDNAGALEDIENVLARSPNDVLALSLRASLRGNSGDIQGAKDDLQATNHSISSRNSYKSRLGNTDCDLEYLARGWAFISIADFGAAHADFQYAIGLRKKPDTYLLGCRALTKVNSALLRSDRSTIRQGLAELDHTIEMLRDFAKKQETVRHSSGYKPADIIDGLPTHAYGIFFLRGMAYFTQHSFANALEDFEQGIKLRPKEVLDTGEFRFALSQLRAETGDLEGGRMDLNFAFVIFDADYFADALICDSF